MENTKSILGNYVEVTNNLPHSVSYNTDKVSRVWSIPGSVKKVLREEIIDACNTVGGRRLFEEGALLISDKDFANELGIEYDSEFVITLEELTRILKSGTIVELEGVLKLGSDTMLENLIQLAITTKLSDVSKMNIIHQYTGKDIQKMLIDLTGDVAEETNKKEERVVRRVVE